MMHCGGGPGPDSFNSMSAGIPQPPEASPQNDLFQALVAWREHGKAPERVIATKFESADPKRIAMQRPLCAYPQRAAYAGTGSTAAAESFVCKRPVTPSATRR